MITFVTSKEVINTPEQANEELQRLESFIACLPQVTPVVRVDVGKTKWTSKGFQHFFSGIEVKSPVKIVLRMSPQNLICFFGSVSSLEIDTESTLIVFNGTDETKEDTWSAHRGVDADVDSDTNAVDGRIYETDDDLEDEFEETQI